MCEGALTPLQKITSEKMSLNSIIPERSKNNRDLPVEESLIKIINFRG